MICQGNSSGFSVSVCFLHSHIDASEADKRSSELISLENRFADDESHGPVRRNRGFIEI